MKHFKLFWLDGNIEDIYGEERLKRINLIKYYGRR